MTSCFPLPLDIRDTGDGRTYRLLNQFVYCRGAVEIVAPAGLRTDFASIPRLLWRVMPPMGRYNRAAVIHDYGYQAGWNSRAVVDAIFLEAMEALDVPWLTRWTMYMGVRLFGWRYYKSRRRR